MATGDKTSERQHRGSQRQCSYLWRSFHIRYHNQSAFPLLHHATATWLTRIGLTNFKAVWKTDCACVFMFYRGGVSGPRQSGLCAFCIHMQQTEAEPQEKSEKVTNTQSVNVSVYENWLSGVATSKPSIPKHEKLTLCFHALIIPREIVVYSCMCYYLSFAPCLKKKWSYWLVCQNILVSGTFTCFGLWIYQTCQAVNVA